MHVGIDTIAFKLMNLGNYEEVTSRLISGNKTFEGHMVFQEIRDEEGNSIEPKIITREKAYKIDESRFEETREDKRIRLTLTSASYDINYFINIGEESCYFEFSIPKYLYGSNIHSFPDPNNRKHDILYYELVDFLHEFFRYNFGIMLNFSDVRLMRIDICGNYYFDSVENKQIYKDNLYDLFRDNFKDGAIRVYSDMDTVQYFTRDYSFKIYDKQKEFWKHDFKKVKKFYGEDKAIEWYKKSETILRAELTFRGRKINYDFFNNIEKFNQVSANFKREFIPLKKERFRMQSLLEKLATRYNNYLTGKDATFKRAGIKEDELKKFMKFDFEIIENTLERLRAEEFEKYRPYKYMDLKVHLKPHYARKWEKYGQLTAPKQIFFDLPEWKKRYMKLAAPDLVQFDEQLFDFVIDKFASIVTEVNDFPTHDVSPLSVLNYEKKLLEELGFKKGSLGKYLKLAQTMSDKEMIKKGLYARQTINRIKQKIELINSEIHKKNPDRSIAKFDLPEKMSVKKM